MSQNKYPKGGVYQYKGVNYTTIHAAKMKIGQIWVPCVVYKSLKDQRVYVRERMDFNEKFTRITEVK